jgi:peroxiredoxin
MKTKYFLLGASLFIAVSVMAGTNAYKISFTVKGWQNKICFLGFYYGENPYISLNKQGKKDSIKVDAKGNFEFTGDSVLAPGVYFAITKDNKQRLEFLVDKEQHFSIEADTNDMLGLTKIKGSEENTIFYEYQNFLTKKHKEDEKYKADKNKAMSDTVAKEVKRYCRNIIQKHPDMLFAKLLLAAEEIEVPPSPKLANGREDSTFPYRYYKAHYFDNVDLSDSRLIRSPVLFPHIKYYLTKLTLQDPDSIIVSADYLINKAKSSKEMFRFLVGYITNTYETSEIMGMDKVFVHMAKKYYTPEQAYWISASQMERIQERAAQLEPILIGKRAPSLTLPDSSNVMRTMDSIKANYIVLYFWDYDCGHCQKATPKLVKWYDSIKGEGVEVYAVEENEKDLKKWKDYVKKNKLDWTNVSDIFNTSNFRHDYDVITTPTIYVLDENKNIIAKKINVEDLDKIIKHDKEKRSLDN